MNGTKIMTRIAAAMVIVLFLGIMPSYTATGIDSPPVPTLAPDPFMSPQAAGILWPSPREVTSGRGAANPSIAADAGGNWHIVYREYEQRGDVYDYYIKYVNDDFGPVILAQSTYPGGALLAYPSIASDGSGHLHVVYPSTTGDDIYHLMYMNNTSGSWSSPQEVTSGRVAANPSIAADAGGNWHIVYRECEPRGDVVDYYIKYVNNNSGPVILAQSTYPGGALLAYPSIASDSSGHLHVVYPSTTGDDIYHLMYMNNTSGSWSSPREVTSGRGAANPSIAADAGGNWHIVYREYEQRGDVYDYYIKYVNDDFGPVILAQSTYPGGALLAYPSIASDGSGHLHVVYPSTTGDDIYHLMYMKSTPLHLEITQGIQTITNTVLLVENKPTFVRVYVDCGSGCTSQPGVTGVLRGNGPSGELPDSPLTSINSFITAYHEDWTNQRGDLIKTLNFTLPSAWRTGTVTLTAEINLSGRIESSSETVSFQQARSPGIIYLPVRYNGKEPTPRVDDAFSWAQRVWPTASIDYIRWPTMEWSPSPQCQLSNDCLKRDLKNKLTASYWQGQGGDYIFGWLSEETQIGVLGSSDPTWYGGEGKAAFGLDDPTDGTRILVHETAHLMGRRHTNTTASGCGAVDTESDWVREDGLPGPPPFPDSKIQDYGLDGCGSDWLVSSSGAVKQPAMTFDYMSYCWVTSYGGQPAWTSPWTYEHIYSETLKLQPSNSTVRPFAIPQPYFIASGLVYTDGTTVLDPFWVITPTVAPEDLSPGAQYCLEAQDASGTPLASHCFDLTFVNYESGAAASIDGFSLILPYPSGVARIVLKKGVTELAVRPVTASAPVVTVLSPNDGDVWSAAGTYTVTWSAGDADGDPLTYSVLYSPDGTSWVPVGSMITDTYVAVSAADLAGSSTAHIRIMASDGINTASDESEGVFTVGRKLPLANITTPGSGIAVLPGTPLWFQGYASDLEDEMLGESALQWSSSRDGSLGTGHEILITLSPGQHVITLTAQDSDGNTATATVNVFVGFQVHLPLVLRNR